MKNVLSQTLIDTGHHACIIVCRLLLIVLLLAPALTLSAQTTDANIIDSDYCGSTTDGSDGKNLTWTLTADGTLTISGTGAMEDYTYKYIGGTIISASPWAQSHLSELKHLVIEEGVTSIGSYAFYGCSGFSGTLTIPNSVTTIGNKAFNGCSGFAGALTIGESVTTIGNIAFSGCSGFTGALTIPNSVTSIGDNAFDGCSGFTGTLTIPNSVTTIGSSAFYGCSGFSGTLTIGESVTEIGSYAFDGCSGFAGALTIGESVTTIGNNAFWGCSGFTGTLTIPNSVTTIGKFAFAGCSGFTGALTIPNSVTTIGDNAFDGCSGFAGALTIGESVTTIGDNAFRGCSGFSGTLTIPNSVTTIGDNAFRGCSGFSGTLTIPNSVTTIGSSAFYGCSGFSGTLTIGESVTEIGSYAFEDCDNIANYNIKPTTPPAVGRYALGWDPSNKVAYIPDGTRSAYESSDWGNLGLIFMDGEDMKVELTINVTAPGTLVQEIKNAGHAPNKVTKLTLTGTLDDNDWTMIKSNMPLLYSLDLAGIENTTMPSLKGMKRLIEFVFPEKLVSIPGYALNGTNVTGTLTIPNSVTEIGSSAFKECKGLTGTLTIPEGVTSIGEYAFGACSGFTGSLTIPNSVTKIGSGAFENCKGFTGTLTIPEGVTSIGSSAFSGCKGLTGEVVIPNSVTTLGSRSFANTGINTIVFGKNITSIPSDIVSGCTIDSITCYSIEPPKVDADFVDVDTEKCKLKVPAGTKRSYEIASIWVNFFNIVEVDVPADMYLVKASAMNGRIVSAETTETLIATTVEKDSILALQLIPDEGYRLASLTIDGEDYTGNVAEDGTFNTPAVTANMEMAAVFTEIVYTVKIYTVGSGVVLSHEIPYGGWFVVKAEAENEGKPLQSVTVQGVDWLNRLENGRLTITDIFEDKVIVIDTTDPSTTVDYAPEHHSDRLRVWTADGRIFVAADAVMRTVEVFDLNGRHITTTVPNATATDIHVPQRHTSYIIKAHLSDGSIRTAKAAVE